VIKTILLVDDDEGLRDVLAESLVYDGYQVECCAHGADALAKLRDGLKPDLILLDLMMPVMDGWEFREAQLTDPELADIPVVVITAAGSLNRPIDANKILRKPFGLDDLIRTLAAL
jgi:CheY-like chemotaxis protein